MFIEILIPNTELSGLLMDLLELEDIVQSIIDNNEAYFTKQQLQKINFCLDLICEITSRRVDSASNRRSYHQGLNIRRQVEMELLNCLLIIAFGIKHGLTKMNTQVMEDLRCEVNRFHRLIDYHILLKSLKDEEFPREVLLDFEVTYMSLKATLFACTKFSKDRNEKVDYWLLNLRQKLGNFIHSA